MVNATLERNFWIETPDQPGISQKLASLFADNAKDNIRALYGNAWNGQGQFFIFPDQFAKAQAVLKKSEYKNFKEDQALVIRAKDQPGSLAEVTHRLANNGINIKFIFTTVFDGEPAVIANTDNNAKALDLFN